MYAVQRMPSFAKWNEGPSGSQRRHCFRHAVLVGDASQPRSSKGALPASKVSHPAQMRVRLPTLGSRTQRLGQLLPRPSLRRVPIGHMPQSARTWHLGFDSITVPHFTRPLNCRRAFEPVMLECEVAHEPLPALTADRAAVSCFTAAASYWCRCYSTPSFKT